MRQVQYEIHAFEIALNLHVPSLYSFSFFYALFKALQTLVILIQPNYTSESKSELHIKKNVAVIAEIRKNNKTIITTLNTTITWPTILITQLFNARIRNDYLVPKCKSILIEFLGIFSNYNLKYCRLSIFLLGCYEIVWIHNDMYYNIEFNLDSYADNVICLDVLYRHSFNQKVLTVHKQNLPFDLYVT